MLPPENFPTDSHRSNGLHLWCSECMKPMKFVATANSRARAIDPNASQITVADIDVGSECWYCWSITDASWDHVIPLTRGGSNSRENIVPCCGTCNRSKRNRTPDEWIAGIWIS